MTYLKDVIDIRDHVGRTFGLWIFSTIDRSG